MIHTRVAFMRAVGLVKPLNFQKGLSASERLELASFHKMSSALVKVCSALYLCFHRGDALSPVSQ